MSPQEARTHLRSCSELGAELKRDPAPWLSAWSSPSISGPLLSLQAAGVQGHMRLLWGQIALENCLFLLLYPFSWDCGASWQIRSCPVGGPKWTPPLRVFLLGCRVPGLSQLLIFLSPFSFLMWTEFQWRSRGAALGVIFEVAL